MRKKTKQKLILLTLVVIFVGYAVYNYYLISSNKKIIELNTEKQSIAARLKGLEDFSMKKKDALSRIEELETAISIVSEKIPDYNFSIELAAELYNLKTKNVFNVENINVNYSEEADTGTIKISLNTAGSIGDIDQVISYFKNNKRRIYLKNFSMQMGENDTYKASLNLEAYYKVDNNSK